MTTAALPHKASTCDDFRGRRLGTQTQLLGVSTLTSTNHDSRGVQRNIQKLALQDNAPKRKATKTTPSPTLDNQSLGFHPKNPRNHAEKMSTPTTPSRRKTTPKDAAVASTEKRSEISFCPAHLHNNGRLANLEHNFQTKELRMSTSHNTIINHQHHKPLRD
jgi:hypothetical protein